MKFVRTCTAIIFPKRVRNETIKKKKGKRIVCEFAAGPDASSIHLPPLFSQAGFKPVVTLELARG